MLHKKALKDLKRDPLYFFLQINAYDLNNRNMFPMPVQDGVWNYIISSVENADENNNNRKMFPMPVQDGVENYIISSVENADENNNKGRCFPCQSKMV